MNSPFLSSRSLRFGAAAITALSFFISPQPCGAETTDKLPASLPVEFTRPASPFLMLTEPEIAALRIRVKKLPWAKQCAAHIQQQAEEILKSPNPFPDKEAGYGHRFACPKCGGRLKYDKLSPNKHLCPSCNQWLEGENYNEGHRYAAMMETASELQTLAGAYLITGDKRYAEGLAISFSDIAAKYNRFRLHDNQMRFDPELVAGRQWCGGRAHSQWIDECSMLTAMLPSYDVLLGSGVLSPAEKNQIEGGLWNHALEYLHLIMGKRGSGANWDFWADSCAVMVGIAFGDQKLVDEGINSPKCGLLTMVRGGYFNRDGFIGELSPGYHQYVMSALFRAFVATRRVGIPLDELEPFQRMIDLLPKIRLRNGELPVLGDSRPGSLNPFFYELGWNWYRKPEYARVLAEYYAGQPVRESSLTALLYGPDELPAPVPMTESSFLSDTMLAVLRTPHSDWHALLKCDSGIGGHRHPDAMNLHLYANGEEAIPSTGSPEYTNPLLNEWFRQTISHNTVVLNTRSQAKRTKAQRMEFALSQWGSSVAEMSVDGVQDDSAEHPARLRRLVAMTPHGVIDIFRVESVAAPGQPGADSVNLVDWALHLEGTLTLKQPTAPWRESLLPKERLEAKSDPKTKLHPHDGYKYFTDLAKITGTGTVQGRLTQTKGGMMDLWVTSGAPAAEVFVMKSPGGSTSILKKRTTLLQRCSANDTVYVGFYAPHTGQPRVESVQFAKISANGAEVGFEVLHKDGKDLVLSLAKEGVLEAAGAKLEGTFGCGVGLPDGGHQVMLIGKAWQANGVHLRLNQVGSVVVDVQSGKTRIYNASAQEATGTLETKESKQARPFSVAAGQVLNL